MKQLEVENWAKSIHSVIYDSMDWIVILILNTLNIIIKAPSKIILMHIGKGENVTNLHLHVYPLNSE